MHRQTLAWEGSGCRAGAAGALLPPTNTCRALVGGEMPARLGLHQRDMGGWETGETRLRRSSGCQELPFRLPRAVFPHSKRWHVQHPLTDVLARPLPGRRGHKVSPSRRCHRSECQQRGQILQRNPQPCSGLIYTPETLPRSEEPALIDGSVTGPTPRHLHPPPAPGDSPAPPAPRSPICPPRHRPTEPSPPPGCREDARQRPEASLAASVPVGLQRDSASRSNPCLREASPGSLSPPAAVPGGYQLCQRLIQPLGSFHIPIVHLQSHPPSLQNASLIPSR